VAWVLAPPDRRARDHTNVLKEVEDCLTAAGLWLDDSNKVIRHVTVSWADPVPGGDIRVEVSQCNG
jgi:Holliday junction resolvase RusA-like endonuclease